MDTDFVLKFIMRVGKKICLDQIFSNPCEQCFLVKNVFISPLFPYWHNSEQALHVYDSSVLPIFHASLLFSFFWNKQKVFSTKGIWKEF